MNNQQLNEPKDINDLVYNENRYKDIDAPASILIPSSTVMFKLMRACIYVKTPKELWFN